MKLSVRPASVLRGVFIGLCCLASSCATLPRGGISNQIKPEQVVARLEERRRAVRSFLMRGEISLTGRQGELSGDHYIQGAWPDRLRADLSGPFGRRLLSLSVDGERLVVVDFSEAKVYRGRASRANVARFLGIALSPREVYTMLSGSVPLLAPARAKLAESAGKGAMVLRLLPPGGGVLQGVRFHLPDWRVSEAWVDEVESGQGNRITIVYGDFQQTPWGVFPKDLSVKDRDGRQLNLRNRELTVNPKMDGRAFEFSPPAGLPVVELD